MKQTVLDPCVDLVQAGAQCREVLLRGAVCRPVPRGGETLRTIEGHLTQTYMKLGISSRDKLAGAIAVQD